jgi:prepilin-type N-terminal cleavage/methylation domain-containing protein
MRTHFRFARPHRGFTLIETLVGVAVFAVVAWSAYSAFTSIFQGLTILRQRGAAANLANEQFEILRNMPYASVGIVGGLPAGSFPRVQVIVRDEIAFTVTATIRNVDLPQDGTVGGTPGDTSPADARFVEMVVSCTDCKIGNPITISGRISPKGVESLNNEGAIYVRVVDSAGSPIDDATVTVQRVIAGTSIDVTDVTDVNGEYMLVGVPTGTAAYRVTATKDGYSTDRTYASVTGNTSPNPRDATVVAGQVTNLTFVIDRMASLSISSLDATCGAVPNFDFTLVGSKQIGTNVPKYSQATTTGSGSQLNINTLEWDTYSFTPTDTSHMIVGTNPPYPFTLQPDSTMDIDLVLASRLYPALLVTVLDGAGNPIADANVSVFIGGATSTRQTGRGASSQTNWNGGASQALIGSLTRYWQTDGNIATPSGELQLRRSGSTFLTSGWLESSTFDLGTTTEFGVMSWLPATQNANLGANPVRFQIATNEFNTSTTTWSYVGPDGTSSTFFTSPGTSINATHNGDRFVRYKVYLSRSTTNATPAVTDVSFTYATECAPPGQASFGGLGTGSARITVSKSGFLSQILTRTIGSAWNSVVVTLGQ